MSNEDEVLSNKDFIVNRIADGRYVGKCLQYQALQVIESDPAECLRKIREAVYIKLTGE